MSMMDSILLLLINYIIAGDSNNRASILVKTALFDEIVQRTELRSFEKSLQGHIHGMELQTPRAALLESAKEAAEMILEHIDSSDGIGRLARTLIADTWKEKDNVDLVGMFHGWIDELENIETGAMNERLTGDSPILKYGGRVRQTLQNRVFGMTKGDRMGIFPSTARPGDQVGIVAGLDLPCIFSKRGEEFAYVGEAYVEGVMFGEFRETDEVMFRDLKII